YVIVVDFGGGHLDADQALDHALGPDFLEIHSLRDPRRHRREDVASVEGPARRVQEQRLVRDREGACRTPERLRRKREDAVVRSYQRRPRGRLDGNRAAWRPDAWV